MISPSDIQALKERMPEYLEIVHGVTDTRKKFPVPWRANDAHPSCKYAPKTFTVIDTAKGDAKDVFQLAAHDFGIDRFPDQVRKVAEVLKYGELGEDTSPIRKKPPRPRFDAPKDAGFGNDALLMYAELMGDLFNNDDGLAYLHGRGFSDEKLFQNSLGYIPNKNCIVDDDGKPLFTMPEPNTPKGYIVIPFPTDETFCRVEYAMIRAIPGDKPPVNKEIRPTGYSSPLYREWLLGASCSVLYIVEGLLDCLALEMLIHRPCLALGGTSLWRRLGQVLNATPEDKRPRKIVLALDADEHGIEADRKIASDLEYLNIPYSRLPWPEGCKDACDVLLMVGDAHGS